MSRTRRVAGWVLIPPLALMLIYLVVVNAVLNLGVGHRLMNSHPELVHVGYRYAWSLWPGRVHAADMDISGQDTAFHFEITAERGAMSFSLHGIRDKIITGNNLRGHGVAIRVRTRVRAMPSAAALATLPEITGYPSPLLASGPDPRTGRRRRTGGRA